MASHYGIKVVKWGPITSDSEGHLYSNVTVEVSRLYRGILLLQEGLPLIERLPIRHWPRAFWLLYRMMRRR